MKRGKGKRRAKKKTSGTRTVVIAAVSAFLVAAAVLAAIRLFPQKTETVLVSPTVRGIDVSHHNGTVHWKDLTTKDRMSFVFIKASEGATYADGEFGRNAYGARRAGLKVGAYHFLTTSSSADEQFTNFKNALKGFHLDLLPVLDAEIMSPGNILTKKDYVKLARRWVDLCRAEFGRSPIIYCSRDYYRLYFKDDFKDCPYWCGNVFAKKSYVDQENWAIWQKGIYKCHGTRGKVDVNILAPGTTIEDISIPNDEWGIDVSRHQGRIDWGSVPRVAFVYIKATEGATYRDPEYERNLAGARKAGIPVGSYHVFRTSSSASEQARNFISSAPGKSQDLIPMVDVEEAKQWSISQYQDSLRLFISLIKKHYGKAPMIYSVQNFYNDVCAPEFNSYHLYIGRYGDSRPVISGKGTYTVWQYSEKGTVTGIPKPVDLAVFHSKRSIKDIWLRD